MNFLLKFLSIICILVSINIALAETDNEFKVGAILILSGEGAAIGTASKNGLEMAAADINSAGGILGRKIKIAYQDDQGQSTKAIAAFRQLSDFEKINFIIGTTWTNTGLTIAEMAVKNKVVMISPSLGSPKFNEAGKFLFNLWPHDYILSDNLAQYVYDKGHRKIALIGAEEPWVKDQTVAFKNKFETLGGEIAFLAEPLPGTNDLRTEALRIKSIPDIDAFVSTTDGVIIGSLLAKALKDLKVNLPAYSITLDQVAIDAAAGAFEGLEFLTFFTPAPDFQNRYEKQFNTHMDIGADTAYDALTLLASAINRTNSADPEIVAEELGKIKEYQGVSGHLISDSKRAFNKKYSTKKIANGRPVDF